MIMIKQVYLQKVVHFLVLLPSFVESLYFQAYLIMNGEESLSAKKGVTKEREHDKIPE